MSSQRNVRIAALLTVLIGAISMPTGVKAAPVFDDCEESEAYCWAYEVAYWSCQEPPNHPPVDPLVWCPYDVGYFFSGGEECTFNVQFQCEEVESCQLPSPC